MRPSSSSSCVSLLFLSAIFTASLVGEIVGIWKKTLGREKIFVEKVLYPEEKIGYAIK